VNDEEKADRAKSVVPRDTTASRSKEPDFDNLMNLV
jgi:hypothetical protein